MHILSKYNFHQILEGLQKNVASGNIYEISHPEYPDLKLYNYTQECQNSKNWNDFTLSARGLILDLESQTIVALPLSKFFNNTELQWGLNPLDYLPKQSYEIQEKADGSLGIVYWYKNMWRVATRGSFKSEQAQMGQIILDRLIKDGLVLDSDCTHLFEITGPQNRIVVNYEEDSLRYITSFNNKTFEEKDLPHPNLPCVRRYSLSLSEMVASLTGPYENMEGYVVRYANGYRIKFKHIEYLRLHRIVTNISPISIWESLCGALKDFKDPSVLIEEYKHTVPEEHWEYFQDTIIYLYTKATLLLNETTDWVASHPNLPRKEFALKAQIDGIVLSWAMMLYDNQPRNIVLLAILKGLRPTGNIL